ncbi:TrkH family potassium uptake protein [Tabrizicola sp. J26]|uniref:TrkH family potassium uptake protein n=1 Tax=Alitabrizicola rongguiensis TaxID=2909234 RepID=UPI001F24402A|nr:TrkH family potassium uptake protein [Tabrizicola rongguiensis]MCF1708525.1 TrkH family potassium uptake protein [Tabrizicola rongguiensis]
MRLSMASAMIDLRPVGYILAVMIVVLGVLMFIPATVDWMAASGNETAFLTCGVISIAGGLFLALATRNSLGPAMTIRQAFLLTAAIWITVPLVGSIPFMAGAPSAPFIDAYFEAVSGITTTGSTVFVGLDNMPPGMNLWRGMLNWLGGLGIAFIAMIFLPVMRVGGMQFFRTEGFDTFGKVAPRATDIAKSLLWVYFALTVACALTYLAIGMTPLDATVNAMASIATGGFSPTDISFSKYQGAGEYAGALFMVLGSLPYIRYVQMTTGSPVSMWRDKQARAYLLWLMMAVLVVTAWRVVVHGGSVEPIFREALFNLTSIMSGTGFFSGSFAAWGSFSLVVAFALGLIGGCSSSSSGALTVFRVQVSLSAIKAQLRLIASPSQIIPVKYDGRTVDDETMNGIVMYVCAYILTIGVMSVAVTLMGVDTESALMAVWTSIGNIGYGYGPLVARTGTFVDFPDTAKALLIVTMLMGRLALLAIFVVVLPRFWMR